MTSFFKSRSGRSLAYDQTDGAGPGVVFLGGFQSDKEGTKARYLEEWAQTRARAFLRFDYSGHGQSSGLFVDGTIGDWAEDAHDIIAALTDGPQILVGSSMGGWISLLLAKRLPEKISGLVTIAAAPDFTEDGKWAGFSDDQRRQLSDQGYAELPSEYSDEPYIVTRKLIEDGREWLVLRSPLNLTFPTRFLHGAADIDVDQEVALRLLEHAEGPDIQLLLVKGADHRFSTPECLELIVQAIDDVTELARPAVA